MSNAVDTAQVNLTSDILKHPEHYNHPSVQRLVRAYQGRSEPYAAQKKSWLKIEFLLNSVSVFGGLGDRV